MSRFAARRRRWSWRPRQSSAVTSGARAGWAARRVGERRSAARAESAPHAFGGTEFSWESTPQSSFKRPRVTHLLHPLAAELEFLDRRQVRCEPGSTIELDRAGVLREYPCTDGLEPLFEHARLRAVPEHAPNPAGPGRGSNIEGPDLGRIRGRTFVSTWAESHPANHIALDFGYEQLRHAFDDGLAPHCLALLDRQRRQIFSGQDALVGGLPGGDVAFRDLTGILKPAEVHVHAVDCHPTQSFPPARPVPPPPPPRPRAPPSH